MREFEFNLTDLEARNIVSDCATIGTRIEAYRTREPSEHPALIVSKSSKAAVPTEHCVPEVDAKEFTVDHLRSALG